MMYVKKATGPSLKHRKRFTAVFYSGIDTNSLDTASFFLTMQQRKIHPQDLPMQIALGKRQNPNRPWKEIERVAESFHQSHD